MKDLNEDVRDFEMTLVNWNGVLYTNPDSIKEISQPDDKTPWIEKGAEEVHQMGDHVLVSYTLTLHHSKEPVALDSSEADD